MNDREVMEAAGLKLHPNIGVPDPESVLRACRELVGLRKDEKRLNYMLRNARLAMVEDGDELGLWLTDREDERAFAILAQCSGDDSDEPLTAEDAPFLTDEQRAHLNGTVPKARGFVNDPAALRAALDVAMAAATQGEPGATPEGT